MTKFGTPKEELTKYGVVWPEKQKFPQPAQRITRDEFEYAVHHATWPAKESHYKSIYVPEDTGLKHLGGCAFWDCHGAFYVCISVQRHKNAEPRMKGLTYFLKPSSDSTYGQEIAYYRIGCKHENMKGLPSRFRHDHRFECPDCGFAYSYDSSG